MSPYELSGRLDAYLALRQALGFTMRAERTLLRDFVQFLEIQGSLNPIRAQAALDWACSSSSARGGSGQVTRLSMARRFLHHLRASYPDTEVPDFNLVARLRRPIPYLFSTQEIEQLLMAARQVWPSRFSTATHACCPHRPFIEHRAAGRRGDAVDSCRRSLGRSGGTLGYSRDQVSEVTARAAPRNYD